MTNRQAFLDAICEQWRDNPSRLIFADWLDEQGENERAEFIRVQCELVKLTADDYEKKARKCVESRTVAVASPTAIEVHRSALKRIEALRHRERELLDKWEVKIGPPRKFASQIRNWAAWSGDLIVRVTGETVPAFRRGFVAEITVSYAAWLEHRERLLKAAPLENVTLTSIPWMRPGDTYTLLRGQKLSGEMKDGRIIDLSF